MKLWQKICFMLQERGFSTPEIGEMIERDHNSHVQYQTIQTTYEERKQWNSIIINVRRSYTSYSYKRWQHCMIVQNTFVTAKKPSKNTMTTRKTLNQSLDNPFQMKKRFLCWLVKPLIAVVLLKSFEFAFATSCVEGCCCKW